MNKKNLLAVSVALALITTACSENKTSTQYINEANQLVAQKQYNNAIIELKNAVKQTPKNAEARQLLGEVYLTIGKYLDAEKELEKAIALSEQNDEAITALSFVKLKLNKFDEVYALAESATSVSDNFYVRLLLNAGISAFNNNEKAKSEDYLGQALSIEGFAGDHSLAKAYLKHIERDNKGAMVLLEEIANSDDQYFEAILFKGIVLHELKLYAEAVDALQIYHDLKPFDLRINLMMAKNLILLKEHEKARQLLSVKTLLDTSAMANQLRAQVEYATKNYEQAIQFADTALQANSSLLISKMIFGLSAYQQNNFEQAYYYLNAVNANVAPDHPIKGLIAYLKLELGYAVESASTLQEITQPDANDLDLIIATSLELLQQGDVQVADSLLTNAENSDVTNEQAVQLGLLQHTLGDEQSLNKLELLVKNTPSSPNARAALVAAYITNKNKEAALATTKEWVELEPNSAQANLLAGKTHVLLGKKAIGETYLKKVLTLEESNVFVLTYFARQTLEAGNHGQALKQLEELLLLAPHDKRTLMLYYQAHKQAGTTSVALEHVKQKFSENSNKVSYRTFYAGLQFLEENYQEVFILLESDMVNHQEAPDRYWQLLGDSYYRLDDLNKAESTYDAWIKHRPTLSVPWFRKMQILDKKDDMAGLVQLVKSMNNNFPNEPRIKSLLPYYQILNKEFDNAEQSINQLSGAHKGLPFIKGLIGQISFSRKQYREALENLKVQYQMKPSPENAGFIYTSLIKLDDIEGVHEFFETHIERQPHDVVSKTFYAQFLLDHDFKKAVALYKELLLERPSNIAFLNNAGWSEYKLGNLDTASEYLDKALTIAPEHPSLLDTMAIIYFAKGNVTEARKLITKAKNLEPNNESINKHYQEIHQN